MEDFDFLHKELSRVKEFFEKGNALKLRVLANDLIRPASLENNRSLARISVSAYCLHKLLNKHHVVEGKKWPATKKILSKSLDEALGALKKKDSALFRKELSSLSDDIRKIDVETGRYVQGIFDKARVKYASSAYYYGLSLSQAADLTNADKSTLQKYIGFTKQHDEYEWIGIKKRVEKLREAVES